LLIITKNDIPKQEIFKNSDKEEKKKSSKTAIEETSARPTTKGASRARPGSARPTNKGRAQAPEPPAVVNPNG